MGAPIPGYGRSGGGAPSQEVTFETWMSLALVGKDSPQTLQRLAGTVRVARATLEEAVKKFFPNPPELVTKALDVLAPANK